jgi:hypothetical protein
MRIQRIGGSAQSGEVDILTGGTAYADAYYLSNYPANACDNNLSTAWVNMYYPGPHFWYYYMGEGIKKSCRLMRLTAKYIESGKYGVNSFTLKGTNDQITLDTIISGNNPNDDDPHEYVFPECDPYTFYYLFVAGFSPLEACVGISEIELIA